MFKESTIIGSIVFFVSAAVVAVAYAKILEIERPQHVFLEQYLVPGKSKFNISSNDTCIGEIHLDFSRDKSTILRTTGSIRTNLNGKQLDISIKSHSYFNPLGQLSDASFNVTSSNIEISASASGINPIKIDFSLRAFDKNIKYKSELKGPILIQEFSPGEFRLEYNNNSPINEVYLKSPAKLISEEYKINISAENSAASCNEKSKNSLDLSKIIDRFKGFTSSMKGTI